MGICPHRQRRQLFRASLIGFLGLARHLHPHAIR